MSKTPNFPNTSNASNVSKTPKTVFVGMSGGVDSSVSAILLKQQGYHVVGAYMKNWSRDLPGMKCPWAEDLADAKRVAVKLGLDFEVFDFETEYKQKVVDYMLEEFKKGRTPNPDIMCNQEIKFKLFYDVARERGADFIATGHYARIGRNGEVQSSSGGALRTLLGSDSGRVPVKTGDANRGDTEDGLDFTRRNLQLLRAVDDNKDQTYFLYRISQEAINHTLFPIGHMYKNDVKALAAKYGLDNAYKKESMGVCFVGEVGIKDFLREYIETKPGPIIDRDTNKTIGYHDGAIFYTIGQRRGLHLGGGLPYYVVAKDMAKNTVYVSRDLNNADLWTTKLDLEDVILRERTTCSELPLLKDIYVRLRHRGELIPATLDGKTLSFKSPIKRPASGQSAVIYSGKNAEICLGGGIIK